MRIRYLFLTLCAAISSSVAEAAQLTVTMSSTSPTMSLMAKADEKTVETGDPANYVYSFDATPGEYVLTAYAKDGTTVNGTIEISIGDQNQDIKVHTVTAYATNKNWSIENGDYTLDVKVSTKEGKQQSITVGNSTTAGRKTFIALYGNSYTASFIPSEAHKAENYMPLYKSGTVIFNATVSGAIPLGENYTITIPAKAGFSLGLKSAHLIDFTPIEPIASEENGSEKKLTYFLADNQVYNYRTWMNGALTQAGYFTMSTDETKRPVLAFTESDYMAFNPATVNHDVKNNSGYETGDILVNINPRGHLVMNPGETFKAHALRSWELTDNTSNNYFIEPDFHYSIIGLDGKPSNDVVTVSQNTGSAWADLKAVGTGTAIVLVTYDAIGLNFYKNDLRNPYLGGEYWGAIWPENTAAYVVTVGQAPTGISPNMTINDKYNDESLKLAGKYVDAEHDVFYYLDSEPGASYTFRPEGVAEVTMAYPTIGERAATYTGFGSEGVTLNPDGSYTLLLKEGRQIVRLADASGNAVYQVLTAKPCHREIINASRPGSRIFQPGDQITIQYSGLRHPANKIACVYNMSAFVTYKDIPDGASLTLGKDQYTFGSKASAQAVTVSIPSDIDVNANPEFRLSDGVIQISGYGEPIGNHRSVDYNVGRSSNFSAISIDTYAGTIPGVSIPLSAIREFDIKVNCDVDNADITLSYNGNSVEPAENNLYKGTYGAYTVTVSAAGYRYYKSEFVIGDDAEGLQTFSVSLTPSKEAWDGKTLTEPAVENDIYQIKSGSELAWFANEVNNNSKNNSAKAILLNDIDLGDYPFDPIGTTASKFFGGSFDGGRHHIYGLNIDKPSTNNVGLFGYVKGTAAEPASITGIILHGKVSGKQYVGGIAGYLNTASVDECANYCEIYGTSSNTGGIAGYITNKDSKITNCYNAGTITGTTTVGGIVGAFGTSADNIEKVYNIGKLTGGNKMGAIFGSTSATPSAPNIVNAYAVEDYNICVGYTAVTSEEVESGYLAHALGAPFGQRIVARISQPGRSNDNIDLHPVFNAPAVYEVKYTTSLDSQEKTLYTNGALPEPEQPLGESGTGVWQTTDGQTVTSVSGDCTLFISYSSSGIDSVWTETDTIDVYTISGVLILRNASRSDLEKLPKGMYVAHGYKFVVK